MVNELGEKEFTPDNPMPLKEALSKVLPKTRTAEVYIHEDDGTPCFMPRCGRGHIKFKALYERKKIVKVKKRGEHSETPPSS